MHRCIWITLVITSLAICVVLGFESLERYNTKSVVISQETDHYYWNTSLPSMTICPLTRLDEDKFNAYCKEKDINGTLKGVLRSFLETLANTTYSNMKDMIANSSFEHLQIDPQNYMELIYNLTADLTRAKDDELRVRAESDSAIIHVQQILTEYGICYVTNNFLAEELSARYLIMGKYPDENEYERLAGKKVHLVKSGNLFDGETIYSFIGFKKPISVFAHSPYETLQIGKTNQGYTYAEEAIELELQAMEFITAKGFETETRISQRNCRFRRESNLTHFPTYTKNLCLQECRLNYAYEKCNCIPHFYPNRISNPKPVCSYEKLMTCIANFTTDFIEMRQLTSRCYCLQNCEESIVILEEKRIMGDSAELVGSCGAIAIIKKFPLVRFKRQILFSFTDLLVSIGGTAGLFLGFSVLGAIEIIYFFTLRYYWYLRT